MLYYLHLLEDWWSPLRVFRYISVRAVLGAGCTFLFCLLVGPAILRLLARLKAGQVVRTDAKQPGMYPAHAKKAGTPTMGGILIVIAVTFSCLFWAVPDNRYLWMAVATMIWMGGIGFADDYLKIRRRHSGGLAGRYKIVLMLLWVFIVFTWLQADPGSAARSREVMVPFLKAPVLTGMSGWLAFLFMALVVVGASNAVNLTDGLDGLAIGCSGSAAFAYLVMAYAAGHRAFADYLLVPYIEGSGELAVFCACLIGACMGFLWFNCHPAQVFMGDTGSLALGGAIAMVAVLVKQEIVLVLVGGIFVMEALSVIIQVASFKLRGKRVFAMAPIHHHFEKRDWSETQVTVRFWILSIIFAILGVLSLKVR